MQSRHVSSKQNTLWIHYQRFGEGRRAIKGWYCKCKVVGCCAHVTSVIWYLGFARHQPTMKIQAATIGQNLRDARNIERSPNVENRNEEEDGQPAGN